MAVYLVETVVTGGYLALLFWVNHIGMPALHPDHGLSVVEQQVGCTRNVRIPPALDFVFGGLNFQIEHHLLPGCPSMRLRQVRAIVRPLCHAHSIPYREESFGQAVRSVSCHISRVARVARTPVAGTE